MKILQVMKGPNEIPAFDHEHIQYPQFASTKFDGFRCLNLCGERLLSPNLKDIRNRNLPLHLQEFIIECRKHRLVTDGELWSSSRGFHEEVKEAGISSILTTHDRIIPDDIQYHIFDMMTEAEWDNGTELPFIKRYLNYSSILRGFPNVKCVEQYHVISADEAEEFFDNQIAFGHEGMILRSQQAKYKHGRCTMKQDGMWKFKEFNTLDGVIVDVEEQMKLKAGVARTTNVVGHLEREHSKELYEPAGLLGALIIEKDGKRFGVKPGKGYNNMRKIELWNRRHTLLGKHAEFRFMPHGSLHKPRIGSLVRFRPDLD